MVITAIHLGGPESFVIEIESTRVVQLMEVFSGDLNHLSNHLKLMNDRMVLVNPKFNSAPPTEPVEAKAQEEVV